jgi:5-(carboxyamino)imidazole ribonucleotide synthase
MAQLRPHLTSEEEFVARYRRQRADSYRLLALHEGPRVLALAGYPLGLRFEFFDENAEAPAGHLGGLTVAEWADRAALDAFSGAVDLVTYEFENVPVAAAERLATRVPVFPPPKALDVAQDRLKEKSLFRRLDIGTAPFATVDTRADLDRAAAEIGLPSVLKTRTQGYDGKGQRVLRRGEDLDPAFAAIGGRPLILEGFVPFERELSIIAARSRSGETAYWPLIENVHRDGILRLSIAPASGADDAFADEAAAIAARTLEALDYVGVLAIELFQHEGRLLANEMAPRTTRGTGRSRAQRRASSRITSGPSSACRWAPRARPACRRWSTSSARPRTPPPCLRSTARTFTCTESPRVRGASWAT